MFPFQLWSWSPTVCGMDDAWGLGRHEQYSDQFTLLQINPNKDWWRAGLRGSVSLVIHYGTYDEVCAWMERVALTRRLPRTR